MKKVLKKEIVAFMIALLLVNNLFIGVSAAEVSKEKAIEGVTSDVSEQKKEILSVKFDTESDVKDDGIYTDGAMLVSDGDAAATQKARYEFDVQNEGTISFEYDYKFETIVADTDCISFGVASKSDTGKDASSGDGRIFQLKMVKDKIQYKAGNASDYTKYDIDGTDWVSIRVELDLAAKNCDIYVGDTLALENQPIALKSEDVTLTGVDCLAFFTDKSTYADALIDNIGVYKLVTTSSVTPDAPESDNESKEEVLSVKFDTASDVKDNGIYADGAMLVSDSDAVATQKARYEFDVQNEGTISFEYDYKFETIVADTDCISFGVASKSDTGKDASSGDGRIFQLKMVKDKIQYKAGNASDYTKYDIDGTDWVSIRVELDLAAKNCDIYVGDTLALENQPIALKSEDVTLTGVDCLAFFTDKSTYADVLIDNIGVYKIVTTPGVTPDVPVVSEKVPANLDSIDYLGDGWKIQVPVENPNKPGSVKEVYPAEIENGYADEYFYVAKDDDGCDVVVFHCPVDGYKTGNTTYSRSELREMLDPDDKTVNWGWEGTHTLTAKQKVTHVPASGKVITSQIHGIEKNGDNANPLVKVQYYYKDGAGSVNVFLKDTTASTSADFTYKYPNVDLGEVFTTEIQVVDGVVYVTIDTEDSEPETYMHDFVAADAYWKETLYYFKLGNYIQDSTDTSATAYADVWVYNGDVEHTAEVTKIGVESLSIVNEGVNIAPGERTSLDVSVAPIKAYNKDVTWSVIEGLDVIAVDKDGNITAKKCGEAKVRATSVENTQAYAECTIIVSEKEEEVVEVYRTDFGTSEVDNLDTAFDSNGTDITSISATGAKVSIKNEDGNNVVKFEDSTHGSPAKLAIEFPKQVGTTTVSFRARIDALGINKAGSTAFGRFYAVASGGDEWYSNTSELFRVRSTASGESGNYYDLSYVLTNAYLALETNEDKVIGDYGDWVDITLIITPNNGTAKANTTDVYMNGYLVGETKANRNVINYVNRLDIHSGAGDIIEFSIDDVCVYSGAKLPEGAVLEAPESLELVNVPSTMGIKDSVKVSTVATPEGSNPEVIYTVLDGDAVVISRDGYVTAEKVGVATIRATSAVDSSVYVEKKITVKENNELVRVTSVEFDVENVNIKKDSEVQLKVNVVPTNATEQGLKYEIMSGSDKIAMTTVGLVTGKEIGTATVKVTSLDNDQLVDYITIAVISDLENGAIVYEDSFNGTKLDTNYWSISAGSNYTAVNVANNAMSVEDGNSAAQPKAALTFNPVCGTVSMQFKIKIGNEVNTQSGIASTGYGNIRLAFGSGTITSTSNEAFCLRTNGTSFTYSNEAGSAYNDLAGDYSLADWNTITLVSNINVNGTDTTDIYVNGAKLVEGAVNKVDYSVIDKMCFSSDTSKYAFYEISDLCIWVGGYNDKPDGNGGGENAGPSDGNGGGGNAGPSDGNGEGENAGPSDGNGEGEKAETNDGKNSEEVIIESPHTGNVWLPYRLIVLGAVMIILGAGAVLMIKKEKRR